MPAPKFHLTEPFAQRPVRPRAVMAHMGWRLKPYDITLPGEELDEDDFSRALAGAIADLPLPAVSEARPGVGFVIRHQGRGWSYLVLCWWDRENELPMRIWTRKREPDAHWAPAGPDQSICVWDAQVLDFERGAYVENVLAHPDQPNIDAYLAERLEINP